MPQDTILLYMVGHHVMLEDMISKFRDDFIDNPENASSSLKELTAGLRKHHSTEEDAIFRFCNPLGSDFCKIVQGLIKQHGLLMEMVDKISRELAIKDIAEVDKFRRLMESHRNVEEKTVYPRMDRDLGEMEKQMIINKIKEVVLK